MKSLKYIAFILFLILFSSLIYQSLAKREPNFTTNIKVVDDCADKFFTPKCYSFSGTAKIIDGDSILVGQKEVRLLDIDAPEFQQKCLDVNKKEYFCGQVAKEYLINFIENRNIFCYYLKKDIYNRYLSYCYIDDKNINFNLVKNGIAIAYKYTKNKFVNDLESLARQNKIGIWQGEFENPKDFRAKKHN